MKLVSVIIPCFNAAPRLPATLNSILSQSYPNIEIIFVNDNSTDDSLKIATEFAKDCPRPIKIANTKPDARGVCCARALGVELSSGEFVQYLDADDELAPDKIALQVAALEADATIDIATCKTILRDYLDGPAIEYPLPIIEGDINSIGWFLAKNGTSIHSYLLRRRVVDCLRKEQAWFPGCKYSEDREYFTIAAMLGFKFSDFVPDAVVYYNFWSDKQATTLSKQKQIPEYQAIEKRLAAIANRPDVRNRISLEDRKLFKIGFDLFEIWPLTIEQETVGEDAIKLTNAITSDSLVVNAREAEIAAFLAEHGVKPCWLFQLGNLVWKHICIQKWRYRRRKWRDQTEVILVLDKFYKAGLFSNL